MLGDKTKWEKTRKGRGKENGKEKEKIRLTLVILREKSVTKGGERCRLGKTRRHMTITLAKAYPSES